jgi:hypothetical protein
MTPVEKLVARLNKPGFAPVLTDKEIALALAEEKAMMCKFACDYIDDRCHANFEGNIEAEIDAEEYFEIFKKIM